MFVQFYIKLNEAGLESCRPSICRRDFDDIDTMILLASDFSAWISCHQLEINGDVILKDSKIVGKLLKIVPREGDWGYTWYF